jgi:hypothetical protein
MTTDGQKKKVIINLQAEDYREVGNRNSEAMYLPDL